VIVTGAGEKAFIAGADIGELAKLGPVDGREHARKGQAVVDRLERMPVPTIAAINGFAYGGGLELALACALRVASENAKMGLPETSLGILPGYGGTQRLARAVGAARALELILTSEKGVTAAEAHRIGLVNRVVPSGQALAGAREIAAKIASNGPVRVPYALEAVRRGLEMPLSEGLVLEATLFGLCAATDDMKEGMTAFLEKRPARFTGADAVGSDLVSACIFCAGFLLGGDLPPRPGLGTEIGLSYSTLAREIPGRFEGENADVSDVTPKFVLIGMGYARSAAADLGAGTPAFEWRTRVALGPSHDEQLRKPGTVSGPIETDGTGRYENFAVLGRFPIGNGSIELGIDRRNMHATEVLNIGGEEQQVSEQRNLTAERADGAIGWRQRFRNFEAAVAARYVKVTGYNATAGAFHNSSGGVFGASVEGRYRHRLLDGHAFRRADERVDRRPRGKPPRLPRAGHFGGREAGSGSTRSRVFLAPHRSDAHGDLRPPETPVRFPRGARRRNRRLRFGLPSRFRQRAGLRRSDAPARVHTGNSREAGSPPRRRQRERALDRRRRKPPIGDPGRPAGGAFRRRSLTNAGVSGARLLPGRGLFDRPRQLTSRARRDVG
jgi:enoyl-CoA hydratase